MAYIKAQRPEEQHYYDYLENLRQSGATNMYGARQYLCAAFPLSTDDAGRILKDWMDGHNDPSRRMDGPLSKNVTSITMQTVAKVRTRKRSKGV